MLCTGQEVSDELFILKLARSRLYHHVHYHTPRDGTNHHRRSVVLRLHPEGLCSLLLSGAAPVAVKACADSDQSGAVTAAGAWPCCAFSAPVDAKKPSTRLQYKRKHLAIFVCTICDRIFRRGNSGQMIQLVLWPASAEVTSCANSLEPQPAMNQTTADSQCRQNLGPQGESPSNVIVRDGGIRSP